MALNFHRDLNRPITHFDNVAGQWVGVGLGYALAISSIGSVAIPWEHQAQKALRVLLPVAGMVANIGASWKVRELQLMNPYFQDRAIARRDIGATMTAAQTMPYLQQPIQTIQQTTPALMPAHGGMMPFDVQSFLDEVTGVAILGNSGSGKTALAQYIAGHLPPSQIIVFDADTEPDDEFYPWGDLLVLNDYDQIIEQMEKLLDLLEKRDKTPLVIICDEFPGIRAYAKQIGSDIPDRFILQYGSRGRKRNKFPIFISQSGNVKSLGLDGQGDFLENFALIRLQKIARKYLKNHPDRELFEASKIIAYPMLIGDDEFVQHPTHGQYPAARKNLPPMNLKPLVSLPITIPLVEVDRPGNRETAYPTTVDKPLTPDHAITPSHAPINWLESLYRLDSRNHAELEDIPLECPDCSSRNISRHAKNRNGSQRYRCGNCGKTFTPGG
jgi:energy-coupling factor transporter ATP-binding protein EcfA2/ribosomal protein S27AE